MSADDSTRPWGRYEVLQESDLHKVKCIYVKPGTRLSYQRHQKRREHWVIVSGVATVVLDGETFTKLPGETVAVEVGQLHRIGNSGTDELIFIEVQTGTTLAKMILSVLRMITPDKSLLYSSST